MVEILDTTLRDGTQGEGVSLSVDDKVAIARRLAAFGIHLIEGVARLQPQGRRVLPAHEGVDLGAARLAAFGATRRKGLAPEEDPSVLALLEAETPVVVLFGKSWTLHVLEALETSLEENLRMIEETVAFFARRGRRVVYDAEHFFDGYKEDPAYALATLGPPSGAGPTPWSFATPTGEPPRGGLRHHQGGGGAVSGGPGGHPPPQRRRPRRGQRPRGGAGRGHPRPGHHQRLRGKVRQPQPHELPPHPGLQVRDPRHLPGKAEGAQGGFPLRGRKGQPHPQPPRPLRGEAAFAHKAGVHVSAVLKNPRTYEHIPPEWVGNQRRFLVSDVSGRSNLLAKLQELGVDLSKEEARRLLDEVKALEYEGYAFEGAEASFYLLAHRLKGGSLPFSVEGFSVFVHGRGLSTAWAEATVRVRVGRASSTPPRKAPSGPSPPWIGPSARPCCSSIRSFPRWSSRTTRCGSSPARRRGRTPGCGSWWR